MFNRKKIKELEKRIKSLEKDSMTTYNLNKQAFTNLINMNKDKVIGKCFKHSMTIHVFGNMFIREEAFFKVNDVKYNINGMFFVGVQIKMQLEPNTNYYDYNDDVTTSNLGTEITEKEFQDAYTEYAISKGLLPKEDASKKDNNKPKK